ncbi:beta-galactosidase [Patescibacteria group bacterium]
MGFIKKIIFFILKIVLKIVVFLLVVFVLLTAFLFIFNPPEQENQKFGVNFSQKHAKDLGLDWKETYTALLDDLEVKKLKVAAHWDLLEPKDGEFFFEDLDWQIEEAQKREAKVLLAIGMKTPRWPECHFPEWAKGLSKEEQQEKILEMLREVVLRYKDSGAIEHWQVENEPFFPFGVCSWVDRDFLQKEIDLVRSLDSQERPVIITDTGEFSTWLTAARMGDKAGTTMYRKVWFRQIGFYLSYPFPPSYYWRKAQIVKLLLNKEVLVVELQAEPWGPKLLYDSPLSEQEKTMNLAQFKKNIDFAKRTGFKEYYLWGAEWWHWMKEVQGNSEIWNEAKILFSP